MANPPPRLLAPPLAPAGVVFDLDGTLLDTEPLYFASYAAVCARRCGAAAPAYSFERVHHALLGRPEHVGAAAFARILGLDMAPEQVIAERDEHFVPRLVDVAPLPGALRVVAGVRAAGVPMAVATSSSREYLALKRRNNEALFAPFGEAGERVVCGTDAAMAGRRGKPAPDIFLAAAALLGVEPARCVAFEDAVAGIEAAKAAGMFVVAVPDARLSAEEVAAAKPDLVLSSLEDLDLEALLRGGGGGGGEGAR
jgi:pseudouridine-5'-monophosphatase